LDDNEDDDDEITPFEIINNIDDVEVQRDFKATLQAWIDTRTGNKKNQQECIDNDPGFWCIITFYAGGGKITYYWHLDKSCIVTQWRNN